MFISVSRYKAQKSLEGIETQSFLPLPGRIPKRYKAQKSLEGIETSLSQIFLIFLPSYKAQKSLEGIETFSSPLRRRLNQGYKAQKSLEGIETTKGIVAVGGYEIALQSTEIPGRD